MGIPCRHAVAALGYRKQRPELYVDDYYSRTKYAECYTEVDAPKLLPPTYKNGPGRPRKLRIREFDENGARMRRQGVAYKCTKCDQFGHN